ncbi:hypothetical protein [Acidovorax sp. sif0613]|uniref:hypothetical protein n=2 Tax=unclassified Acidovorax TaxID=2684926 RepID=UPI001C48A17B|nr:hypothetical protein [Acidovorax sp. sif0613]
MLMKSCPSMGLHRVSLLPLCEGDGDPTALVLVPFITPYSSGQSLRATLQAVLGRQLRGYRLAFDVPRHTAKGTLYIHRRDLEGAKRCLASGLPQLELGCAASASCAGALSCR